MSQLKKRTRNLYGQGEKPFRLSRSKVELFLKCPRCFYLDRKLGISPPSGPPFTINSTVDHLLKKEFDHYRNLSQPHPLMVENQIQAIPFSHPSLEAWREALRKGIQHLHQNTNLLLTGAIDDLWVNEKGEIIIVDYKATSKKGEVSLDADWQMSYKRQMDFYAYLFQKEGFQVFEKGYFVYTNASVEEPSFSNTLKFKTKVLAHQIDTSWVEEVIDEIKATLESEQSPKESDSCPQCQYNLLIKSLA